MNRPVGIGRHYGQRDGLPCKGCRGTDSSPSAQNNTERMAVFIINATFKSKAGVWLILLISHKCLCLILCIPTNPRDPLYKQTNVRYNIKAVGGTEQGG